MLAKKQFSHDKAEVHEFWGSREELQGVLRRLANSKAEISSLQELLSKEKLHKRDISYDELSVTEASETDDSNQDRRRRRQRHKKSRALTSTLMKKIWDKKVLLKVLRGWGRRGLRF